MPLPHYKYSTHIILLHFSNFAVLTKTSQQWMSLALEANYKAIADEEEDTVQQEYEEIDETNDNDFDVDYLNKKSDTCGSGTNVE